MAARKSAQPTVPADDSFDAILAAAEKQIAERTSDLKVEDQVVVVKGEIVTPAPKESTPVVTKSKSTALATKPVREPAILSLKETISFGGVAIPFTVSLSDKALPELEAIVSKGLAVVFAVGAALAEINARGLYKEAGFSSFEKYLNDRWHMSKARGYQAIQGSKTVKGLVAAGVDPKDIPGEAAVRQLEQTVKTGDPVAIISAFNKAKELGGGTVTVQSANEAAQATGTARSAGTVDSKANRTARVQSNTSAPGSKPAAKPAPVTGTANGLEPVTVKEGREQVGRMIKAFMNGTFRRNDNDKLGTVAAMRTLRDYIETWLGGNVDAVQAPVKATDANRAIIATVTGEGADAPATVSTDQGSKERGLDFAKRVVADPKPFDADVVEWAQGMVAVPATKAEADARKADAAAAEVAPEAKVLMAATKAARPQTGTDKRRAAEKAAAEVVAVAPAKPAAKVARTTKSKAA